MKEIIQTIAKELVKFKDDKNYYQDSVFLSKDFRGTLIFIKDLLLIQNLVRDLPQETAPIVDHKK